MTDLRDHSQPCEHGKRHTHASIPPGELIETWCPGGREMTLREVVAWVNAEFATAIGDTDE